MAKHAAWTQVWAYSAAQMAQVLENEHGDEYKQGLLDAMRAVARLESAEIDHLQLQDVLDDLPSGWASENRSAYFAGFQEMYGILAETFATSSLGDVPVQFLDQNVVYEGEIVYFEPEPAV